MITISLCMIVKNEEKRLETCVRSLAECYDELILVDTGSSDRTKQVAESLGAKVYDFPWCDDFAAARNFAFSKASCDYIYSADADEHLDEENRQRLKTLKQVLDPEIEIVQMWYKGQMAYETVYNYDRELRPKLFKRLRTFVWEGAVHEMVRTQALTFDSDIEITHSPGESHAARDLSYFRGMIDRGEALSSRLYDMYARELCKAGTTEDLRLAVPFFEEAAEDTGRTQDEIKQAFYLLGRAAREAGDEVTFFKYALRDTASEAASEMCYELGLYFEEKKMWRESILWFYNAAYEASPLLDKQRGGRKALEKLSALYRLTGEEEEARRYEEAIASLPEEAC